MSVLVVLVVVVVALAVPELVFSYNGVAVDVMPGSPGAGNVPYPAAEPQVLDVELVVDAVGAEAVPPPAATTQEQTARAEDATWRPVTAPQPLTMQSKAALWMADDWELLHWQAKSVWAQPTSDAADDKQKAFKGRLARIG